MHLSQFGHYANISKNLILFRYFYLSAEGKKENQTFP